MELKQSLSSVNTTTTTLFLSLSPSTIFSKYSPQKSQIQFLEEASTGLCVGPHTLHMDQMTPPPPPLLECPSALYCTTLQYITI